jgi:hypothetical protein
MAVTVTDDSPVITQPASPVIVVVNNANTVEADSENYVISVGINEALVIPAIDTNTVIASSESLVMLAAGIQGPQGLRGPIGLSGGTGFELIAGIDLGGNRAITGIAEYADNTDFKTIGRTIGITAGAASAGLPVSIVANGELDGFFGLTVNDPVYLSVNGTTTQTIPTTGYLQKLGVAVSDTRILIRINEPWAL